MLSTLSLSEYLLSRGKRFAAHGMPRAAGADLAIVASFGAGSVDNSAEASGFLAEMSLSRRRYKLARRHAEAALKAAPTCPEYQYLCGRAWENGTGANQEKAAKHYLDCLELNPAHVGARCALGLLRVAMGLANEGLAILRNAHETTPWNFDYFLALYRGLRRAGRSAEARGHLRAARFHLRKDPRFVAFQDRLRYRSAARRQRAGQPGEAVILPFLRLADPVAPHKGERLRSTTLRIDAPGTVQEPHAFRLRRRQRGRNA